MLPILRLIWLKSLILLLFILLVFPVGCSLNYTSPPLGKKHVTVGGKLDIEARLLTKMYALLLQNDGFDVTERAGLGNTSQVFQALKSGSIDLYPEFTATGLNTLGIASSHNAQKDYNTVRDGFEKQFQITWLAYSPLNDGYAICTSKDQSQRLGITSISQLAPMVATLTLASPSDGIPFIDNLKSTYRFDTKSFKNLQRVDYATGFTSVINDQAQVNVCYTTDGSVTQENFVFLQDDKNGFPQFNPAPIVRDNILAKYPEIKDVLNRLAPMLTTEVSIALQAEVHAGFSETTVVTNWLRSQRLM